MVDLLIAGAGIAGSSPAILAGRQGFTVNLYECSRFPCEKGEGLMPALAAPRRGVGHVAGNFSAAPAAHRCGRTS